MVRLFLIFRLFVIKLLEFEDLWEFVTLYSVPFVMLYSIIANE